MRSVHPEHRLPAKILEPGFCLSVEPGRTSTTVLTFQILDMSLLCAVRIVFTATAFLANVPLQMSENPPDVSIIFST